MSAGGRVPKSRMEQSMNARTQRRDLTTGPAGKQIFLFALPLLGASLIQQLYNTVDLLFVGNILGTEATAAVGASSLLTSCIVGFFTGLSIGTGVVVSLAEGQGRREKIRKTVHTAMGISLIGGIVLTAAGLLLSRRILLWMNTPEEILEQALAYVRIYLLSMLPLFLYNMNSGIIRARGDSRTPMLFQLLGAVINLAFDWITMKYWGMGVDGAAWATFGAQLAAGLGSVVYLMRREDAYRLELGKICISGDILREILRIGVPAGLQNMVITISNIFVQTAINGLGVSVIAAFTAYFKVELILYLPIVAFGQAATTFVGQNLGAGKTGRMRATGLWPFFPGYGGGRDRTADYPCDLPVLLAVCDSGGSCRCAPRHRQFHAAYGGDPALSVCAAYAASFRIYAGMGQPGGSSRRISVCMAGCSRLPYIFLAAGGCGV